MSSVSATDMSEGHETQEDEIHSIELGQGSILEDEEVLAPEENNLQVIPWEMRDEVTAAAEISDEQNIYVHRGADVLQSTRIFSCFICPPVPLCRLIPYARVRGLRDDLSGLKAAFAKEGYMQEKGAFIISLWTFKREQTLVTGELGHLLVLLKFDVLYYQELNDIPCFVFEDEIKEHWDPLWREINEEFELELKCQPKFGELSNHMFYVWEGNHRTLAWTEAIREKFSTSKEKHCRVLCTIIDPTKVPEIALLSSLQRMNV